MYYVKGNCGVKIGNWTLIMCIRYFWSLKLLKSFAVLL